MDEIAGTLNADLAVLMITEVNYRTGYKHDMKALTAAAHAADKPQIAVAVMVENGESGSGVAAPVVKQVLDAWLLGPDGQLKAEYRGPVSAVSKQP